jgi:hypothetical protein
MVLLRKVLVVGNDNGATLFGEEPPIIEVSASVKR